MHTVDALCTEFRASTYKIHTIMYIGLCVNCDEKSNQNVGQNTKKAISLSDIAV